MLSVALSWTTASVEHVSMFFGDFPGANPVISVRRGSCVDQCMVYCSVNALKPALGHAWRKYFRTAASLVSPD